MRLTWFLQFSAFNLRKISAQIDIQMFHRLQERADATWRRVNTFFGGEEKTLLATMLPSHSNLPPYSHLPHY